MTTDEFDAELKKQYAAVIAGVSAMATRIEELEHSNRTLSEGSVLVHRDNEALRKRVAELEADNAILRRDRDVCERGEREAEEALGREIGRVAELEVEIRSSRELLLDANPLVLGPDGTVDRGLPLPEVARRAGEKIEHLRRLHAEMLHEAVKLDGECSDSRRRVEELETTMEAIREVLAHRSHPFAMYAYNLATAVLKREGTK